MANGKSDTGYQLAIVETDFYSDEDIVKEEYSSYLRPNEIVNGYPFELRYRIKNSGEKNFPGGALEDIELTWGQGGFGGLTTSYSKDFSIPALAEDSDDECELVISIEKLRMTGTAALSFRVSANDSGEVAIGDSIDDDNPVEEWIEPIYVYDRYLIKIADEVSNIRKELSGK